MEDEENHVSRLQGLYNLGLAIFKRNGGGTPSQEEVLSLLAALEGVEVDELGLSAAIEDTPVDTADPVPGTLWSPSGSTVTYLPVHEANLLHIGVFCLPAGAAIPLHDHPGMTVLSRVLYGRVRIAAYDWLRNDGVGKGGIARKVAEDELAGPRGTCTLFPSYANVHSLTAVTTCAVLDVLAPPYARASGRDCTYFQAVALGDNDAAEDLGTELVRLKPCDPPEDFEVKRGIYHGDKVQG